MNAHPAFGEARRLRAGVRSMRDVDGCTRAAAMIALTGDETGSIATGLIALYRDETNGVEALALAFLAGLLIGRDE